MLHVWVPFKTPSSTTHTYPNVASTNGSSPAKLSQFLPFLCFNFDNCLKSSSLRVLLSLGYKSNELEGEGAVIEWSKAQFIGPHNLVCYHNGRTSCHTSTFPALCDDRAPQMFQINKILCGHFQMQFTFIHTSVHPGTHGRDSQKEEVTVDKSRIAKGLDINCGCCEAVESIILG